MAKSKPSLSFGFPRMHKEPAERRDFLPDLIEHIAQRGCEVFVESGIGSGMSLCDEDYESRSPRVHVVDNLEAYRQDVVLVLRCPELDELCKLQRGATLMSMLHFPTRPRRVKRLLEQGLSAISLDSIVDDEGRRLVENMRAVGWNGVEAGFQALERTAPGLLTSARVVRVTVMGIGQVGKHAVEAATKYGDRRRAQQLIAAGAAGVEVVVVPRQLTCDERYMRARLSQTDMLVDSTQRADPTTPLIPNAWLSELPAHAVVVDLVVDPYVLHVEPKTVRSIEGIPQGDLEQYVFMPDDPAWDRSVPGSVPSKHRRATATCYSWPGVHPEACMAHYGRQLAPLLDVVIRRGGGADLRAGDDALERALSRAALGAWAHTAAQAEREQED